MGDAGTKAILDPPTEQEAYEVLIKLGLIRPTNEASSPVDNIVVIEDITDEDDIKIGTGKYDVKVQECKLEKTDPETPKTDMNRISAGPDGSLFFNNDGQRCSVRVK